MTRRLRMNLLLGCAVVAGLYLPGAWRSMYATPVVHASMAAGSGDAGLLQEPSSDAAPHELDLQSSRKQ